MRNLKRFFAVFVATIMLLGNIPAYAAVNKGAAAKAEYLKTEKRFFSELSKSFEKSEFGKLLEFSESINGTYSSEMDIEIKLPDIKTRKYIIKENGTYTDRYEDGAIEAFVEGEQVATFNIVANDNYVSIQVPELYEKYLTVDMNDIGGLIKKFDDSVDTTEFPSGMFYNSDIKEALALTKAEEKLINSSLNKYAKLLDKELLKNDYFKKGNKQTLNINNIAYKCDEVSYEISGAQLVDGIEIVWNEIKKDHEFIDLIWRKIENIYELSMKTNSITQELPTKEQVLGAIDTVIDKLQESSKDDGVFKSVLYHQDGKLIKRDIGAVSSNGEEAIVSLYTLTNSKGGYYAICAGEVKAEDIVTKNQKETIHNIVLTSQNIDYDFVDGELVTSKVEQINKMNIKVNKINNNQYNVDFSVEGADVLVGMEYINNKATSKEHNISLNFDVVAEGQIYEVDTDLIYKKDIKLNKINTKNNEINLNEKSKEELVKLYEDNKDEILDKVKGKFASAFYYDEIMKSTQSTMERMQIRADVATGAQIGKAVRVWFTEYQVDPAMKMEVDNNIGLSANKWTKYSDLYRIEEYIMSEMTTSDGYDYYVGLTADGATAKIAVALAKDVGELPELNSFTEVSDASEGARVIYIEP